jgi:hypothetical protein
LSLGDWLLPKYVREEFLQSFNNRRQLLHLSDRRQASEDIHVLIHGCGGGDDATNNSDAAKQLVEA